MSPSTSSLATDLFAPPPRTDADRLEDSVRAGRRPSTLNNRRSYECPPFLHGAAGRCPPHEAHSLVADFSTSTSTLSRTWPHDPQAWATMPGYLMVRNLGWSGTKSAPPLGRSLPSIHWSC